MDSKLDKILEFYEKSCVYGKIYEDRYRAVEKLKGYLDLGDFFDIYVKNIAGTELNDEIYFFSKSIIVKIGFQIKANGVFADQKVYRISEVSNARLIDDITYDKDITLDLEFMDGSKISIDNREKSSETDDELVEKQREINKSILESVFKDLIRFLSDPIMR